MQPIKKTVPSDEDTVFSYSYGNIKDIICL